MDIVTRFVATVCRDSTLILQFQKMTLLAERHRQSRFFVLVLVLNEMVLVLLLDSHGAASRSTSNRLRLSTSAKMQAKVSVLLI